MFKKEMWERVGGYKQHFAPAEDTEFWVRGLASGFTCKVASEGGYFLYRGHPNSASKILKYGAIDEDKPYLRDQRFPLAAPTEGTPFVKSYSEPIVTIRLEVQKQQLSTLTRAIDSVLGQSVRDWELLIINNTNRDISDLLKVYPFIVTEEHAPYYLTLDADNRLQPTAVEKYLHALINHRLLEAPEVYIRPEGVIMSKCCGGNGDATIRAKQILGMLPKDVPPAEMKGKVAMRFVGERRGTVDYVVPGTRTIYSGGNNDDARFVLADPKHVAWLESTQVWRREPMIQEPTPLPTPKEEPKEQPKEQPKVEPAKESPKSVEYQIDQGNPWPSPLPVVTN
jgi:hypothetical protein